MVDPIVGYGIALCIATLLFASGLHKIRDFARFAALLAEYRIVPGRRARSIAIAIPCVEIVLAVGLCFGFSRRDSLGLAILLLTGYGVAMAINLRRGRHDLDCGCGTLRERRPIARWMLWRNALLVAISSIALLPWSSRALQSVDIVTVACGIATAILLYAAMGQLVGVPSVGTNEMRSMR